MFPQHFIPEQTTKKKKKKKKNLFNFSKISCLKFVILLYKYARSIVKIHTTKPHP